MKLLRQLIAQPARTGHRHGRNAMSSAGGERPRPEGIAVTPAIGPLPAIFLPADHRTVADLSIRRKPGAGDDGSL